MIVQFCRDADGAEPAREFLESLDGRIGARFTALLQNLADHDGRLEGVAFKKLHGYSMEEIRVKQSRLLHRIIIQVRVGELTLVLHEFTKLEGERTSEKELEIARERLNQFLNSIQDDDNERR